jgi:hypothetical protein
MMNELNKGARNN